MEQRVYEISAYAKQSQEKALKTVIRSTDSTSLSVWVMKPGQAVRDHVHHKGEDVWICLQGTGVFHPAEDEKVPVSAGKIVVTPKGVCHGMVNTGEEDFIFVSVCPQLSDYEALPV